MTSSSQTLIDERAYIFMFPKLGLPDPKKPKGEDVIIRAAIGTKETPALLSDMTIEAPRRFAGGEGYEAMDLGYEGAVWVLPCLTPQQLPTQSEIFTLKVRRVHPSFMPDPRRRKLPDGRDIIAIQLPPGTYPWQTVTLPAPQHPVYTEEDEAAWWNSRPMEDLMAGRRAKVPFSADQEDEVEPRSMAESIGVNAREAIDEYWQQCTAALAFIEFVKSKGVLPRNDPQFWFRGRADKGTKSVWLDYAISWCNGRGSLPEEGVWKTVPPGGYKPGRELELMNHARRNLGFEEVTQEQLESSRGTRRVEG